MMMLHGLPGVLEGVVYRREAPEHEEAESLLCQGFDMGFLPEIDDVDDTIGLMEQYAIVLNQECKFYRTRPRGFYVIERDYDNGYPDTEFEDYVLKVWIEMTDSDSDDEDHE